MRNRTSSITVKVEADQLTLDDLRYLVEETRSAPEGTPVNLRVSNGVQHDPTPDSISVTVPLEVVSR